jgi:hypothetical protein
MPTVGGEEGLACGGAAPPTARPVSPADVFAAGGAVLLLTLALVLEAEALLLVESPDEEQPVRKAAMARTIKRAKALRMGCLLKYGEMSKAARG